MRILDADLGTDQERWPIEMDDERESREFLLSSHLDDDDDNFT